MFRSRLWYFILPAILALLALPAFSQAPAGEIRLAVVDPTGAPIQASGTLARLSAGTTQRYETDAQGVFTFQNLVLGRYRLEVVKAGFATETLLIDVESAEPISRAVRLSLGVQTTRVEVIATAPLPGVDLTRDQIAAPIQSLSARDIQQTNALSLADVLNRRLNNVYLNEVQGNPFQPDLNYRGYTASPLLGTPQGISVYMDGVRLNQPFGDVVSWDLVPRVAIAETTVIPGSDPLFGLNTLGGALSIRSKDGFSNPGSALQLSGGNFGRRTADLETGGSHSSLNWYGASSMFFEDGWREVSPSNVRQFLGKIGWQGQKTALGALASYANNQLNGSGLQEQRFIARDYASIYTKPDVATNRSPFLNFTGRHAFGEGHVRGRRGVKEPDGVRGCEHAATEREGVVPEAKAERAGRGRVRSPRTQADPCGRGVREAGARQAMIIVELRVRVSAMIAESRDDEAKMAVSHFHFASADEQPL